MTDIENALEIVSRLARVATLNPTGARGTKPGLALEDIGGAIAWAAQECGNPLFGDMAIAIATQDYRLRDRIEGYLEQWLASECERMRRKFSWDAIYPAAADAFEDTMASRRKDGRGGSIYYKWACSEFYGQALNVAIIAQRRLFRNAA